MVDYVNEFINSYAIYIIISIAIPVGAIILFKLLRGIPKQPDYIELFKISMISDEKLNIPNQKYGLKYLYRGQEKLGKITTVSQNFYKVVKYTETEQSSKRDFGKPREEENVFTITFRPKWFNIGIQFYKIGKNKEMLKFTEKDTYAIMKGNRLVFPETTSFTALGNIFTTVINYPKLSRIIEDDYNKRLFEVNTQLFAAKMVNISAESPEMAHELQLKRLEIEKIKAEKQMKTGSLI